MILERLFEKRFEPNRKSYGALWGLVGGIGSTINYDTALTISTAYACIRVLAESVASLPLITYERRAGGGKDRARAHYLYELLKEQPNPEMTSFEFREMLIAHVAARGNGYAEIEYNNSGNPVALWPLNPANMVVERRQGELIYRYTMPDGGLQVFPWYRIHHLRGLMGDGVTGYSVIKQARLSLEYAKSMEEQDSAFYRNGAQPGSVITMDGKMTDEAYSRFSMRWNQTHQGVDNAYRTAILEAGMDIKSIGLTKDDSQFIESRKFQVGEIARWFRVPPHMVGDLERATFSNVEQQSIDFVVHTLRPWLVRSEQAMRRDLIPPEERERIFVEYLIDGLLRGDSAAREAYYSSGFQNGWLTQNDIRRMENLNPIASGDVLYVPVNMLPADQVGQANQPQQERAEYRVVDHGENCQCGANHRQIEARADDDEDAEPEDVRRIRTERQRLARSYIGLYRDVADRMVRRESNDMRRAVNKHLRKRSMESFRDWVTEFYQSWDGIVADGFRAIMLNYAEQVLVNVAGELDEDEDGLTDEIRAFIDEYLAAMGASWAASSRHQVEDLANSQNATDDDAADLIEERIDGWLETQAQKVALKQAFEGLNALVLTLYGAYKVITYRWAASGDSCPFCQRMNGRVVRVGEYFISAGDKVDAEDGSTPMLVRRNKRYGPLHGGCDCTMTAGDRD